MDATTGCPFWGTTPGQPAMCGANQTCNAANGTCVCNNDPMCGTPPMAGDFCPTEGAGTHSTCNMAADGCFTSSPGVACAAGTTCQTATTATVVAAGMACGCTPPVADQTGKTVKLQGTGCTAAQATAAAHVGSAMDAAVLTCKSTGAGMCNTWQITTACAAQQLVGGVDPVTSLPACVCQAPTVPNQYYVDPDPEMSTFMTGQPTGAQFPAACRFRTLTTALAQKGVTEVIAQHTTSSNVHFRTLAASPSLTSCNSPNSCEIFPMDIPAGVHMYTSDVGSFNPLHYVIDVDQTSGAHYAVRLNDKSFVEGYTIDASATNPTLVNAGINVVAVVTTPVTGAWTSTPAVAPITAKLNQVLILSSAVAPVVTAAGTGSPAGTGNETALLVQGQTAVQADFLAIVGGAGTGRGIVLDHATDNFAGTTASLVANHLSVSVVGGNPQAGIELGTNGANNGVSGSGHSVAGDAGNVLTVTNDVTIDGAASLNPHNLRIGTSGVGVHVFNGTATVNGLDVHGSGPAGFVGYFVEMTNSPATAGVNINQGTVNGSGTSGGGIGVWANGGLTTVNGTHITGVANWTGVSVQQVSVTVAATVTVTGTAAAPTLIDVVTPITNATATAGIVVGNGNEHTIVNVVTPAANTVTPRLTIADNTKVTNYMDGIIVNNGHVISTGANVLVTANLRDGLQIFSSLALAGTDPNDPLARISVTGASFTNNGRSGILIRDVAPVSLDGVKVTGNGTAIAGSGLTFDGTGGIDIQRSQISGNNTGFLVNLANSSVSGNTGCGITLSGGDDDLVGRTTATDGTRICGVGTGFDIFGTARAGAVGGPLPGTRTVGTGAGVGGTEVGFVPSGIFGGRTNVGGKISAFVKNTNVQNNSGVGVYVTEARDFDPAFAVDDVTEVSLQGNLVTGNLTSVPASGQDPVAGGIYFAQSNFTSVHTGGTATLSVTDIGCEDVVAVANTHTNCTRIRMSSFLGNTISCNGRAQLAFGLPQRISTSAVGTSPDGDWDISSDGTIVGVDLPMRCSAAASPNTLSGYTGTAANLGLAIPGTATSGTGVSLVHVGAYGVKWSGGTIISGSDYSSALAASPQGNNDATTWGICGGGAPMTCPIALK